MKWYEQFICAVGGADTVVLKKCPAEKKKFLVIGAGVFMTASVSVITMFFALYSIVRKNEVEITGGIESVRQVPYKPGELAAILLAALFWGLVIFLIDFGLVSTFHKEEQTSFKSIGALVFRLAVAIVISFTVSLPLEVAVFRDYLPLIKREMQAGYQDKLGAGLRNSEAAIEDKVRDAGKDLVEWAEKINDMRRDDAMVQALSAKLDELQRQYNELRVQYGEADRKSYEVINAAQRSINQIQTDIRNIQHNGDEEDPADTRRVAELERSKAPYIQKINAENQAVTRRNNALNAAKTSILDKEREIMERYRAIEDEQNVITRQLAGEKQRLEAEQAVLRREAEHEYRQNQAVSSVYIFDNLINNLNALAYLETRIDSPDFGERGIARKILQIRIILMILIMIIDISPVVLKLLAKRGPYEVMIENIKNRHIFRIKADEAAFEEHYPIYAAMVKEGRIRMDQIEAIAGFHKDFNAEVDALRQQTQDEIYAVMKSLDGEKCQGIRELLASYQEQLIERLQKTVTLMTGFFDRSVGSLTPDGGQKTRGA
jgi:hypothetical protein